MSSSDSTIAPSSFTADVYKDPSFARWKPLLVGRKEQLTGPLKGIRTDALEECAGTATVLRCGSARSQESLMENVVGGDGELAARSFMADVYKDPSFARWKPLLVGRTEQLTTTLEEKVRQLEGKNEELKSEREEERCGRQDLRRRRRALYDEENQFRQELKKQERRELDWQSQRLDEERQELREDVCRLRRELEERRREIEEESHRLEVERRELLKDLREHHEQAEYFNQERREHQGEIEKACQEVKDEERCMCQDLSLRQQALEHCLNVERHELLNEFREEHHKQTQCFNDQRDELVKELREEHHQREQCFNEERREHQWKIEKACWEVKEEEQGLERNLEVERHELLKELREEHHQEAERFKEERREDQRELHESAELLKKKEWGLKEEEQVLKAKLEEAEEQQASAETKAKSRITKLCACRVYKAAERAFTSMGIDERLADRLHDRCYCSECYPSTFRDVIKNEGLQAYVVPRGWVRFGLKVPVHAEVHDVWKKWCVSFHGTKLDVAQCIVRTGEFLMPGDTLPDSSVLGSVNCGGRIDKKTYTSPTVNYAGLACYARPAAVPKPFADGSGDQMFQVVLQCRQKPGTFNVQAETMGFRKQRKTDLCPHVACDQIEWVSETRKSIIPYGLLIRTFQRSSPPERYFRSPVDNGLF